MKLSPDGRWLAVQATRDGQTNLYVMTADLKKVVHIHSIINRHIFSFRWLNKERLMFSAGKRFGYLDGRYQETETYFVNYDGSRFRNFFAGESASYRVLHPLYDDPDHIILEKFHATSHGKPVAIRLNISNGKRQIIGQGDGPGNLVTDEHGVVRIFVARDYREDFDRFTIYHRSSADHPWLKIPYRFTPPHEVEVVAFDSSRNVVTLACANGGGRRELLELNVNTAEVKTLFSHPVVDLTGLVYEKGRVVGVGYDDGLPALRTLDPQSVTMSVSSMLHGAFPGQVVDELSLSQDQTKAVFVVRSAQNPGEFYSIDLRTKKARFLAARMPGLRRKDLRPQRPVSFQARDGQTIHGYITEPAGKPPGGHPLIVLPHGGPHGVRDYYGFDPESQFFASRGYATLKINFRGSGGYGLDFQHAGYRKWGTLMQDDVTDGTRWAVARGIANGDRICIYGGSYGGYAALMGVVREPELYQCAIGYVGVYSLPLKFKKGDSTETKAGMKWVTKIIGTDRNDQEERSPVYQARKIKAAVMLVHGADDVRVPVAHFYEMKEALTNAGKKAEYLLKEQEGHGFTKPANRYEAYFRMQQFFDRHTSPPAGATSTAH